MSNPTFDNAAASQFPAITAAMTIAAGSNMIALLHFRCNTSSTVTSVKIGTTDMVLVKKFVHTDGVSGNSDIYVYALVNPPTGAQTATVVVNQNIFYIQFVSYSGAKQTSNPEATNNGGEGTSTTPSGAVTTIGDNSVVVGFFDQSLDGSAPSAGTGTQSRQIYHQTNNGLYAEIMESSPSGVTPAGSKTLNVSGQNTVWSQITVAIANSSQAYSLAITAGAFTLTGNAIAFHITRIMAFATGAFVLTGNAINFSKGKGMAFATGAFVLTGNAIGLRSTRHLSIAAGAFVLTGNSINFLFGKGIQFGTGVFVLTGNAISFTAPTPPTNWLLEAENPNPGWQLEETVRQGSVLEP